MELATLNTPTLIPPADMPVFMRLPQRERDDVILRTRAMHYMAAARSARLGAIEWAAMYPHKSGFSPKRLMALYTAWLPQRDWRILINRARAGVEFWHAPETKLPNAFAEHWKGLVGLNQRKTAPAWRALIRQWQAWRSGDARAAIPGYDTPPSPEAGTDIPSGWSYANLCRRYAPTKFETIAMRIGRSAAADFRPQVFTTRVGTQPGQMYLFDDLWHDFKVVVLGQRQPSRLLQFHCLDLTSGCNIARGMKPVMEDEATGAQERLKEAEMVFLLAHVLGNIGYRPQGTTLVVEHGTAAIREDLENLLAGLTNGAVTVSRSGIEGSPAIAGLYAGRSKGNFRFKAALESSGNLIHNETANTLLIPGQTGSNARINLPEEMHGREQNASALMRALTALPPEVAGQLRFPFLEFTQAMLLVNQVHDTLNARTDHDLEGWLQLGYTAQEWRLDADAPWRPMSDLDRITDPAKRAAIESLISSMPGLVRVRKLAPAEVFARAQSSLVKLPSHAIALILATTDREKVRVADDHLIEFSRQGITFRYLACPEPGQYLQAGQYDAVLNPMAPDTLWLFQSNGAYIGRCPAWQAVCKADTDALQRSCGRAAHIEAELLAPVAARGAELLRRRRDDARHNADLLRAHARGPKSPISKRGFTQNDFVDLADSPAQIASPETTTHSAQDQLSALDDL